MRARVKVGPVHAEIGLSELLVLSLLPSIESKPAKKTSSSLPMKMGLEVSVESMLLGIAAVDAGCLSIIAGIMEGK